MEKSTKNMKEVPGVRIDPALDKYKDVVLFPEKLAKANEDLKKSNFAEVMELMNRTKKQSM